MPPAREKTLRDLQGEHRPVPASRLRAPPTEAAEQSAWRNYVRDLILGFNDGLVSVYAVGAGVAGAAFLPRQVAVAGVAAGVAGALSMGLGEYLSTKSQAEYYAAEAAREREHVRDFPALEREEVREMIEKKGYPPRLVGEMVDHVVADEDRFVEFMMREEFGVGEESGRSPWIAMGLVMAAFVVGAVIPIVPFFLADATSTGLAASTALALLGLFAAGTAKARVSGLVAWKSGAEMALVGALAAAVTFGVGALVGVGLA